MGKQKAPQPPDLTPISNAQLAISQEQNDLAKKYLGITQDQFDFLKTNASQELQFARQQADRSFGLQQSALDTQNQIAAAATKASDAQMATMQQADQYAKEQHDRYNATFVPLQDQMIGFAQNFASPANQEQRAGAAAADNAAAARQQQQAMEQRLISMGVDPSQARNTAMTRALGVQTAANSATAANNARLQTQLTGQQLLGNAVNMGAGLPSQANQSFQTGTNAAGAAVGAATAGQAGQLNAMGQSINYGGNGLNMLSGALGNYANLTGSPMQWAGMSSNLMNSANGTLTNAANTMSSNFNNQLSAANFNNQTTSSEIGNVLGAAGMMAMMRDGGPVRAVRGFEQGGAVWQDPHTGADSVLGSADAGTLQDQTRQPNAAFGVDASGAAVQPHVFDTFAGAHSAAPSWRDKLSKAVAVGRRAGMGSGANAPLQLPDNQMAVPQTPMLQIQTAPGQFIPVPLLQLRAEGGAVQAHTGIMPTPAPVDHIPALLTDGEYVIPTDVVRAKGTEYFDRLTAKYHRPARAV